jgi:hypothetical protein
MSFFILKMNQLSLRALIMVANIVSSCKLEIALFNFNHSVLQIPLLCCSPELQSILGPILFSGMVHSY